MFLMNFNLMRLKIAAALSVCALWAATAPPVQGAVSAPAEDALYAKLSKAVVLSGNYPGEKRLLDMSLGRILRSPFGRSLAEEFLREGVSAKVSFKDVAGSTVTVRDGRQEISGVTGETWTYGAGSEIVINRLYLRADPEYTRIALTETLAHELLGHLLEERKADKAGVGAAYARFEDNETNASLVGWIVSAELGDPAYDYKEMRYRRNIADYKRFNILYDPAYATAFSLRQLSVPLPVLEGRLRWCRHRRERLDRMSDKLSKAGGYIRHLLSRHGGESLAGIFVRPGAFDWLRADMSRREETLAREKKRGQNVERAVKQRMDYFQSRKGRAQLLRIERSLDTAPGKEFFLKAETLLLERRNRLVGLPHPKKKPPVLPPCPAGQISWLNLRRMYREDLRKDPVFLLNNPISESLEEDWARLALLDAE